MLALKLCCCEPPDVSPGETSTPGKDEGTRCPPLFPLLILEITPLAIHSSGSVVLREGSLDQQH